MTVEKERRTAGGRRVPVKTIVEIGVGEAGSAAFEAESVDITTAGMRLRTAYLPEVGEPLVCRFDLSGKEVVVEAAVVWRNEEACGGDFGVRFSDVDQTSLEALHAYTGETPEPCDAADEVEVEHPPARMQRGTRVRLHIEGLGSPMKARVRDATSCEAMVGSNLEFLKIGRPLDLENIDAGDKRGARIERVNIEVDPSSNIPQLVVTMRYLDAPEQQDDEPLQDAADHREAPRADEPRARFADDIEDSDEELARKAGKPDAIWTRLRGVGPTLAAFGGKAKDVVTHALEKARTRATQHADDAPRAPMRTTSPPPAGGLKTAGRKLVREDLETDGDMAKPNVLRKIPKRAAFIGVAAFIVLFAVIAVARKSSAPPTAATSRTDSSASAAADLAPAIPAGALVANIPLFGPTPMSTTEPAALPGGKAPAAAAAATPPPDDKLAAAAAAANGSDSDSASSDDDSSDSDSSGDNAQSDKANSSAKGGKGPKSFAHGKVHHPVVLNVHMANAIKGVHGVSTPMGFTVHVDGAQSKDAVGGLAHKDPRIASIKVANKGSGADLTVQFKDGVPAYAVRAAGSNLQIAIGRAGADKSDVAEKKSAKAEKHHPRKPAKHGKH